MYTHVRTFVVIAINDNSFVYDGARYLLCVVSREWNTHYSLDMYILKYK